MYIPFGVNLIYAYPYTYIYLEKISYAVNLIALPREPVWLRGSEKGIILHFFSFDIIIMILFRPCHPAGVDGGGRYIHGAAKKAPS